MHTTKKFKDLTQKKRQLSHFLNFYVFLTVELPGGKMPNMAAMKAMNGMGGVPGAGKHAGSKKQKKKRKKR